MKEKENAEADDWFEFSTLRIRGEVKGSITTLTSGISNSFIIGTDKGAFYQLSKSDYSNNILLLYQGKKIKIFSLFSY